MGSLPSNKEGAVGYTHHAGIDAQNLKINGTQVTATAAELNALDGITATVTEINKLAGAGAVVASGTQQAHVANASVAHDLNATFSDTEVETALNALGTKINSILTALEAFGVNATS